MISGVIRWVFLPLLLLVVVVMLAVLAALIHMPLVLLLALVLVVVFMRRGRAYGIPRLFWHDARDKQLAAGCAVAILVCEVFLVASLLGGKGSGSLLWLTGYDLETGPVIGLSIDIFLGIFTTGVLIFAIGARHWLQRVCRKRDRGKEYDHPEEHDELDERTPHGGVWFVLGFVAAIIGVAVALAGLWAAEPHLTALADHERASRLLGSVESPGERIPHMVATLFFTALLIWYFVSGFMPVSFTSPATAFCTLLGVLAAVYGFLTFHFGAAWVGPFLLLLGLMSFVTGSIHRFRVRLPGLTKRYRFRGQRIKLSEYGEKATAFIGRSIHKQGCPLVIVCASGGGIRAAVWTCHVLRALEQKIHGFPYHLPLIFGASGGMLGSAHYVTTLRPPDSKPGEQWRHDIDEDRFLAQVEKESLSETVRHMLSTDLIRTFLPLRGKDRGQVLEHEWQRNMPGLKETFGAMRDGENSGWRPSLVFSPMLVEDGRRLLICNDNLSPLVAARGSEIKRDPIPHPHQLFSHSAFEYRALFSEQELHEMPLSTAARLSATFPYVSPAVALPTTPRRRVVDAGYYDNYGVTLAASWLENRIVTAPDWLKENFSGVAIIQIRDGARQWTQPLSKISEEESSPFSRGVEGLTGPVKAIFSARESTMLLRNDKLLEPLLPRLASFYGGPEDVTTVSFEFGGEASLSWYLSQGEKDDLANYIRQAPFQDKADAFAQWWANRC